MINKAVFTTVEVVQSLCKPVSLPGKIDKAVFTNCEGLVKLVQACLSAGRSKIVVLTIMEEPSSIYHLGVRLGLAELVENIYQDFLCRFCWCKLIQVPTV